MSAADDAAGLAISSSLNVDARILEQAVRNVNDGISTLSVVENSLQQLSQITTRQQELATQAANGVLTLAQRRAIDTEASALTDEYNRIVRSTAFNNRQLLSESSTLTIQAGIGASSGVSLDVGTQLLNITHGTSSSDQSINGAMREVTTIDFYPMAGSAEQGSIAFHDVDIVAGSTENSRIAFSSAATMMSGGFWGFDFYSSTEHYSVRFDVQGVGPISYSGTGTPITVSILAGDSATDVATKVASQLNGSYGVAAASAGIHATIFDTTPGARTDVHGSNLSWVTTQQGWANYKYSGAFFHIYSGGTTYRIGFSNVAGSSTATTADIFYTHGESKASIATKVAAALDAFDAFSAYNTGEHVFYTLAQVGGTPDPIFQCGYAEIHGMVHTQGGMSLHSGDWVSFYNPAGAHFGFYFNHQGVEGTPVSLSGSTNLSVSYTSSSTLEERIDYIAQYINANWSGNFAASVNGTSLTISNLATGGATDLAYDGFGKTFTVTRQQGDTGSTRVNYGTDFFYKVAHGLTTGQRIRISSNEALPTGLSAGVDYYAIRLDNDRFRFATSQANALANVFVNFTSAGVGAQTITAYNDSVPVLTTIIPAIDLATQSAARDALPVLSERLNDIQRELGAIGSSQSRLATVTQTLFSARENYSAAASRILDVDAAMESSQLLRQRILQQSGAAVLAQANTAPELALRLLKLPTTS